MKAGARVYTKAERVLPLGKSMAGDTLTELRVRRLSLTQARLAKHLDVSPHAISNWERNVRPVPLAISLAVRHLVHLAEAHR